MFRKRDESLPPVSPPSPITERVTSVVGAGISLKGNMSGSGGLRIEGAFEGDISLRGLLVIGETGRVTCEHIRANTIIVAGAVRGDITAEKLEIRKTGRVWGNVVTASFATEEGAFLRGQIRMEEHVELGPSEPASNAEPASVNVQPDSGSSQADQDGKDTIPAPQKNRTDKINDSLVEP